jgi:Flp pilus assembly protein TadG
MRTIKKLRSAKASLLSRGGRRRWGTRSGSNAIEFALTFPVFVLVLFGLMEYGWYFYKRMSILEVTRIGCRTGALEHPEDKNPAQRPDVVAKKAIRDLCAQNGLACDLPNRVEVVYVDASPDEAIRCSTRARHPNLTGFGIPVPAELTARAAIHLELQR